VPNFSVVHLPLTPYIASNIGLVVTFLIVNVNILCSQGLIFPLPNFKYLSPLGVCCI
jgi:hypothetical protein